MKHFILIISFMLCMAGTSYPNEPINGLEVFMELMPDNEAVESSITNNKGNFEFKKLKPGNYVVKLLLEKNKAFGDEVKSSKRMYKKYKNSLKAGYNTSKSALLFSSVAGCFHVKFSKLKFIENEQVTLVMDSEFLGSKELVTVCEFTITEEKGRFGGKVAHYPLKKFMKRVGKKKFPPIK